MKKTILYRLFGLGGIPAKLRPILEEEGVIVSDEGVGGWFVTHSVKGPGKRYIHRLEGFSGCLVVTKKRVICFTYWKRQINIPVDDPRLSELYVNTINEQTLSISFESSVFREGWEGVVELRFHTDNAIRFREALTLFGAQQGAPVQKRSA
jgi:hypothetical protein